MKIPFIDKKTGKAKIIPETLEDLWHLDNIIEIGDLVSSSTLRTFKIGTKEEKKPVNIILKIEAIDFSKSLNKLRLRGKIIDGTPEDFVQKGRYHTIEVEQGTKLTIIKKWKLFQLTRLKQAQQESKKPRIRIIVLDDEKALTTVLLGYGVDYGPVIRNHTSKKDDNHEKKSQQYLGDILSYIEKYEEKFIIAGPGFTKDNLKEFIKRKEPKILSRLSFESCSYAERNGVNELLKKGIIEKIIGEQRIEQESILLEELKVRINKDNGLAVYGLKEVKNAVNNSAVEKLLVLDELLRNSKEVQSILEYSEKQKTEIIIFSKESDPGIDLNGLSGIAALLRFQIS